MSRRARYLAALSAAVLLATGACAEGSPGSSRESSPEPTAADGSTASAAADPALQARIDEATAFAASQGIAVSIAVTDREVGAEVVNGAAADTPIFSASLVKLFLADNLLQQQRAGQVQLTPEDRALFETMLVASDDAAADSLYARFGGAEMVIEVAERYQLPSVAPTSEAGSWELTTMSARDVSRYYDRFLARSDAADRDYLIGLLRASAMIARDGFDQFFGIPTALPGVTWAIKQGWMCCPGDTIYLHTTGILGIDNRYTVAILSGDPGVVAPDFSTDVLSQITALVFPPGSVV